MGSNVRASPQQDIRDPKKGKWGATDRGVVPVSDLPKFPNRPPFLGEQISYLVCRGKGYNKTRMGGGGLRETPSRGGKRRDKVLCARWFVLETIIGKGTTYGPSGERGGGRVNQSGWGERTRGTLRPRRKVGHQMGYGNLKKSKCGGV